MTTLPLDSRGTADKRRWTVARDALANGVRRGVAMVSAARHRYRRPALTIAGFGCIDAAFYQVGWFAGLLVTGLSVLVFEWLGGDET